MIYFYAIGNVVVCSDQPAKNAQAFGVESLGFASAEFNDDAEVVVFSQTSIDRMKIAEK